MAALECTLGVALTKRFPRGVVTLNVSEPDREWMSKSKFCISGWDLPLLITKGATGSGEGLMEYMSLARAIMAKAGFEVPKGTYVHRINSDDNYDVAHENLIIPECLIPEFPIENNYNLTLAAYNQGLKEATDRLGDGDGTLITCMEEGTRKNFMFIVDPEDAVFFNGTKIKFSQHGVPLFFCEDMKFRNATQELVRRNRLGVSFGAPDVIFRRLGESKFDIRKGQVAVFRTVRKAGR